MSEARMQYIPVTAAVAIVTAKSTLPFPPDPGACGLVPDEWNSQQKGVTPEIDFDMWSDTAGITLTAGELLGAKVRAFTFADDAVTSIDFTTGTFTKAAHSFRTGDGPVQLKNAGGVIGAGLTANSAIYYLIKTGANTYQLASSRANALAGTAITFTGNGTGTTSVSQDATTMRVHWMSFGLLNPSISLGAQRGSGTRVSHRPNTIAYAVVGTTSGSMNCTMIPVQAA